jgi:hypothetical protein
MGQELKVGNMGNMDNMVQIISSQLLVLLVIEVH